MQMAGRLFWEDHLDGSVRTDGLHVEGFARILWDALHSSRYPTPPTYGATETTLSYGPPWAHYLGGYQDRLLGGPLGLPDLHCTAPAGVKHKDYEGEVLR
jgi:hypothetical protein